MISRIRFVLIFAVAIVVLCAVSSGAAERATLTADELRYDPAAGEIWASGEVRITRSDGEVVADEGRGTVDGRFIELMGNVRGDMTDGTEMANIECARLSISGDAKLRTITASGSVVIMHGEDVLTAEEVVWTQGADRYSARGRVIGRWGSSTLDADEAARDGEKITASGVRRYADASRGLALSASSVEGRVERGRLDELVAHGSVMIEAPDDAGEIIVVHGSTGVWSQARGTIVISGGAYASRGDRSLTAGSIVYHVDTGRVEAVERPSLVIEIND